ncbi:MAG TPA: sulfur carrier protein ThiS [Terriglobales bacterium]|jgi:sulfur carrier protein|nr:sulfur carrier protein ThiS [Terriglobales bacterium]
MNLIINGERREFSEPSLALSALIIEKLGMKGDRVAVELNREIIRRDHWESTLLKNGDRLEIVHFVGGGKS